MKLHILFMLILLTSGCNQSDKLSETNKKEMIPNKENQRSDSWLSQQIKYADLRIAGADMMAFGENPEWSLTILSNGNLKFRSETSFGDFTASNVEGMQPQDLNAMTYGALSDEGSISIMVFSDSCFSEPGEYFPKRFKISGKKGKNNLETFEGCGLYLNDPVVNDIWAVKSWTGQVGEKPFAENAYLEFNLNTQQLRGNLGCGEISGSINPMGSKVNLYGMDYTDKRCQPDSPQMKLFNHLNSKTHTLLISNLNLKLIAQGDTVTFQKVD